MKQMSHFLQNKYKWFSNIVDFDRKSYFTRVISCRGHQNYDYLLQLAYTVCYAVYPKYAICYYAILERL